MLTHRQNIAIETPCFTLDAVAQFQLRQDKPLGNGMLLTTVLAVDAFGDKVEWHASAALQIAPQVFVPFEELDYKEKRILCEECFHLLANVGEQCTQYAEAHFFSFHMKRRVTDLESLRVAQRRIVLPDITAKMGHIDTITAEEAIDGYGYRAERVQAALEAS